ncbi:hypothetical protein [Streptomyces sp. NPDC091278]|uniref:hypothetical protein n=1 Tax=Streptomyces sp. NPDC091278 TaxID=3155301 RepID=UPI00344DC6BA
MRKEGRAVLAALAVVLGAVGCGAEGTAAPVPLATVVPRPPGTGPLTKEVVRADLDGSAANARVPANSRGSLTKDVDDPASPLSCVVRFMGFHEESVPVDIPRYERVLSELGERGWKQRGERQERKAVDGSDSQFTVVLEQRGWRLKTEYRNIGDGGTVSLAAFDEACLKRTGGGGEVRQG